MDRCDGALLAGDKEKVKGFLVGAYSREDVEKEDFVYETTQHSWKEHRLTVMKLTIRNRK